MIPTDEAHFTGFMEGVKMVLAQLERCLKEHDSKDRVLLKLVQDEVALEVSLRMEDEA